jgi:hypothetical protein
MRFLFLVFLLACLPEAKTFQLSLKLSGANQGFIRVERNRQSFLRCVMNAESIPHKQLDHRVMPQEFLSSRRQYMAYMASMAAALLATSASAAPTLVKSEDGLCNQAIRSCPANQKLALSPDGPSRSHLVNQATGQQMYLIGTAHISEASANQVRSASAPPPPVCRRRRHS